MMIVMNATHLLFKLIYKHWRRHAVKEPGHFKVRIILQSGHPDALLSSKKVYDLLLVVAVKTQVTNAVSNKAVRCVNIFIFCSHYYGSKAIRRA